MQSMAQLQSLRLLPTPGYSIVTDLQTSLSVEIFANILAFPALLFRIKRHFVYFPCHFLMISPNWRKCKPASIQSPCLILSCHFCHVNSLHWMGFEI